MVRLYLPGPAELYIDLELGETERRIEELFRQFGLEFEDDRRLPYWSDEAPAESFPLNMGYSVNVVEDARYHGFGGFYSRWVDIPESTRLDQALEYLRRDDLVYHRMHFTFDHFWENEHLEDWDDMASFNQYRHGPVLAIIDRTTFWDEISAQLLDKHKGKHCMVGDQNDSNWYQFAVPLKDIIEDVVDVFTSLQK
jgi:hypothetical protein